VKALARPFKTASDSVKLYPANPFKMSIGRDAAGHDVAEVEDRTTGQVTRARDTGQVARQTQAPGPEHQRDRGQGR
jgi:hypothetical protein